MNKRKNIPLYLIAIIIVLLLFGYYMKQRKSERFLQANDYTTFINSLKSKKYKVDEKGVLLQFDSTFSAPQKLILVNGNPLLIYEYEKYCRVSICDNSRAYYPS